MSHGRHGKCDALHLGFTKLHLLQLPHHYMSH